MSLRALIFPMIQCVLAIGSFELNARMLEYNLVESEPKIYLHPNSERIGHTWVNGMVWDKPLIEQFYSILKQHDPFFVAIDFGAQTGSFSLLSKFFPFSRWHAFEPLKEAADTLKENLLLNGIQNVAVHQMAGSNQSGKAFLKMPSMNAWGLSTLGENVLRFNPLLEREVDCIDLDTFVAIHQIEKVHFIKIDVEGWELNILLGAKNVIARDHPVLLLEYNETNMRQCKIEKNQVDDLLKEMGYEWNLVSSEDILCIPIKS